MRRVLLAFTLLSFLVLGSCVSNQTPYAEDYATGNLGVEIAFMQGTPPALLFEGDPLEVVLELRNLGTFPENGAPQGRVFLSGFDEQAINGIFEDTNVFPTDFTGKTPVNPQGDYVLKVYRDREVRIPFDGDTYTTNLQATLCYKYETLATPTVCIDPEPNNLAQNKACFTRPVSLAGGQGAPIAVTSVEPRIANDEVFITVNLANVGGGRIVSPNGFTSCPFDLDFRDVDQIAVAMKTNFGGLLECNPEGTTFDPVRMIGGRGTITCSFTNPGGNAFTTPIEITARYAYTKSIQQGLTIQNPNFRR